jgi:hypothetical protein
MAVGKRKISTGKYSKAMGKRIATKGIVFFPKRNDVWRMGNYMTTTSCFTFLFTMQPYLLTLIVCLKDMFQTVFFIDKILPEIINDIVAFAVW